MSVAQHLRPTGFGRPIEKPVSAERQDGLDADTARQRLHGYKSLLSTLSTEQRKRVLADVGPEVAGIPGSYEK
ncbi:hypothetical protein IGS68_03460 [Skermanella sp. TT6]|mgnify:CR=1 FL=1|uniref:Uncharacterized protein n=1 Tax=Skermanella cutis TaxID=2775420 RepID=A0ABX7B7H5_9PROT|nr:hypothetical protein [Skermanella sp. TT6]QQP90328.1 hypothetical protein IGS68_03460 [Skermanella sp. TT6]